MQWHPDKHPDNAEEAKAKFQTIQAAYTSLMTTDEDERIEALVGREGAAPAAEVASTAPAAAGAADSGAQ